MILLGWLTVEYFNLQQQGANNCAVAAAESKQADQHQADETTHV